MKKNIITIIIGLIICACSVTKISNDETEDDGIRYFDEKNVEISKSEFKKIRFKKGLIDIIGDSINHKKLTFREKHGEITSRALLEKLIEIQISQEIDSTKPIVIIYYPGKDPCNSSGSATKESRKLWFTTLEEGIYNIAQNKPIYIFKDNEGLEKYEGILKWHKDPEQTIERLFFEHHYPCMSFVVISKDGKYISFFGEFSKEYVWKATEMMNQ